MNSLYKITLFLLLNTLALTAVPGQNFSGQGILLTFGEGTMLTDTRVRVPVYLSGQDSLPGWEVEFEGHPFFSYEFSPTNALPPGINIELVPDFGFNKRFKLYDTSSNTITLPNQTLLGYAEADFSQSSWVKHLQFKPLRAHFLDDDLGDNPNVAIAFSTINTRPNNGNWPNFSIERFETSAFGCNSSSSVTGQAKLKLDIPSNELLIQPLYFDSFSMQSDTLIWDGIGFDESPGILITDTTDENSILVYSKMSNYNNLPPEVRVVSAWADACAPELGYDVAVTNISLNDDYSVLWNDSISSNTLDNFLPTNWWDISGTVAVQYGNCKASGEFYYYPGPTPLELVINQPVQDLRCSQDTFLPGFAYIDTTDLPENLWPLDIIWSTGDTGLVIEIIDPGSYTCDVSFNGECLISDTFQIAVDTLWSTLEDEGTSIYSFYIKPDTNFFHCNDDLGSGSILIDTSGLPSEFLPLTIEWSNGETGGYIDQLPHGQYACTLTNALGCVSTHSINVWDVNPVANSITYTPIFQYSCFYYDSLNVTLDSNTILQPDQLAIVEWSNGDTGFSTNFDVTAVDPHYILTYQNGCSVEKNITLIQSDTTNHPFDINKVLPQCGAANGSIFVDLPGINNYDLLWDDGSTEPTLQNLAAGQYRLTISRESIGCRDTFTILLGCGDASETEILFDSYCDGLGNKFLTAYTTTLTAPYTFIWSTGQQDIFTAYSTISISENEVVSLTVYKSDGTQFTIEAVSHDGDCEQRIGGSVGIRIGHTIVAPGDSIACVPIMATQTDDIEHNIVGFQGTLAYDTNVVQYSHITPVFTPFEYFAHEAESGLIGLLGLSLDVVTALPINNEPLFELCFTPATNLGHAIIEARPSPTYWGFTSSSFYNILPIVTPGSIAIGDPNVWPGDATANGTVNHYDILNLGLLYAESGPPRQDASLFWTEQPAEAWNQQIPTTNLDAAHVDTDGNGTIDFPDQAAIDQNWTLTTPWYDPDQDIELLLPMQSQFATDLFVQPDTVGTNAPATFEIHLGTEEQPAEDVYGLAFSVDFDDFVIDTSAQISISFNDSWLGTIQEDLLATYRVFPSEERIDIGITRVDGEALTGYGMIAQINITIEDVIFFSDEHFFNFTVNTQRLVNQLGQFLPSNAMETTSLIQAGAVPSNIPKTTPSYLSPALYPNPSPGRIFYQFDQPVEIRSLNIISMDGRLVKTFDRLPNLSGMLTLADLPTGVYQLKWVLAEGIGFSKLVIR